MLDTDLLKKGGASETDVRELTAAWEAWQKALHRPVNQMPHIVCTGIYNAGKSTLLNALLDLDTEAEMFPTGDIPTTYMIQSKEFNGAKYIDTPGLNAKQEDDAATGEAYENADVYLFVSNAQNGGITEQEARWLKQICERYADKAGFMDKLVYVLSQCGRLEADAMEKVQEKTKDDLKAVLGTQPGRVFCVDSHDYFSGKAENEPVLLEASGIPQLREFLMEKTTDRAKTLAAEKKKEVRLSRTELLEQIGHMESMFQAQERQKSEVTNRKIRDIKTVWQEFEEKLNELVPVGKSIEPVRDYISFHIDISFSDQRYSSRSAAKRALKERFSGTRTQALDRALKDRKYSFAPYCDNSMDSIYFKSCNAINALLAEYTEKFHDFNMHISGLSEISVTADIPSSFDTHIEYTLRDDVIRGSNSDYIDRYADKEILEWPDYKTGLFGIQYETKYYDSCYPSTIARAMEKDMERYYGYNVPRANRKINDVWQDFLKRLNPEVDKQKAELKKQIDHYCAHLRESAVKSPAQKAAQHLVNLKKEVEA